MTVLLSKYVQVPIEQSSEWEKVADVADRLVEHLNTKSALQKINEVNQPGRSSHDVQDTFLRFAEQLGFESEKKGLFAQAELALRPVYYMELPGSGILLEVERGKTTINNMDLLDFWKCHLCNRAHYLFLLVPQALRQNEKMTPRNEYAIVLRRLSHFFSEENYTNVRGLCVFGY